MKIVLLHGFLGHPDFWRPMLRYWPPRLIDSVVIPHLWEDQIFNPSLSLSQWSKQFWLRTLSTTAQPSEPVHLIGYSMGGRLALEAALARPELVTSLHLISTHPGGLTSQEIAAREVWNSVWAERILTLPWQDLLEMWNSQEIFAHGSASPTPGAEFRTPIPRETVLGSPSSQPDTRPWTWTPLTEGDSTLRQRLAMALKKWSVTQQTFLDAATLWPASVRWYYGDLDAKYRDLYSGPLFQTARLKSANLDFRKIAIPGAGHRIPLDQPKALSDHILTQIKEQT